MKVAELRQIIKEEMGKVMEEQRDIEWRDVSKIFESAMLEAMSHDQYALADMNEVEVIGLRLMSEIKDLVRKQINKWG